MPISVRWIQSSTARLAVCVAFIVALAGGPVYADDSSAGSGSADINAAIDSYLSIVPVSDMMDDMTKNMAQMVPEDKRAEFTETFRATLDPEFLEQVIRDSMAATFSVEEVNALTEFYASEHGKSVMEKLPLYMSEAMPMITQHVQDVVKKQQAIQ